MIWLLLISNSTHLLHDILKYVKIVKLYSFGGLLSVDIQSISLHLICRLNVGFICEYNNSLIRLYSSVFLLLAMFIGICSSINSQSRCFFSGLSRQVFCTIFSLPIFCIQLKWTYFNRFYSSSFVYISNKIEG